MNATSANPVASCDTAFDANCRACPRLVSFLNAERKEFPDYFNAPVPPFGDPKARLLVVGLAPGFHGANASGRPFTGDHAGLILYRTLHQFGFASRPESLSAGDGLKLLNCRITNSVKCVPPANKPLPGEIRNCNRFLSCELRRLHPGTIIVALGKIAHEATLLALQQPVRKFKFVHAAEYSLSPEVTLIDSYHCSRYNTQTKRLTEAMFSAVFARARALLES